MPSIWKKYISNTRGHFAVQFALLGLPLIVATTFVTDYSKADAEKVNVKSALDAAVIAAVNNNALSFREKESYARKHFLENYEGDIQFRLSPSAQEGRVEMSAFGVAPVTVAETLGIEGIEVFEKSAAEQTSENVICALSLAEDGKGRILFDGESRFSAPTCSVHSNSDDSSAIHVMDQASAMAKNFCAVGGATGQYQPYAKGDCAPVRDPYAQMQAPEPGLCINIGNIRDIRNIANNAASQVDENGGFTQTVAFIGGDGGGGGGGGTVGGIVENLTGSNVTLQPGTYCGGLTVDGENVRFAPGNHIMLDGPLVFRNDAQAVAEDATFVMNGLNSVLQVQSGSDVDIKAPAEGALAGMAFFQDVQPQMGVAGNFPNGMNSLSSGGSLNVTGTVYFPTQTVSVVSDSVFGSQAPATSFIAYQLNFAGNSDIRVAVDHQRAGLPPILPRTEDGARLVE